MKLFEKILIANRGEIAVRIIRTAKKLGIQSVCIYSPADKNSLHVKNADEAYVLPGNELSDSYLNIDKIIEISKVSGAEAIHPGYGFLSENPAFVARCEKEGIIFIGPNSEAIRLMGNKIEARKFVDEIGIPLTKGVTGSADELKIKASEIDYPILLKAAAGGGGKGMRIIYTPDELPEAIESTSREAKSYFGDESVYIEKYIENPRHIEVQVIGDNFGNVIHLFERECSVQRRYQKIIEESPASILPNEVRLKIAESAVGIAKAVKYNNAGTIEFLVDKNFNYYFLEMNTRVQVEHPVTELVTNTDIVEEQIKIAAGNPLELKQNNISQNGHAIECRIYAEDPENNFMPSPGQMYSYIEPKAAHLRIDTGIDHATKVESSYDPMISKLIVHGFDRSEARKKALAALKNYNIHGIKTNIQYLIEILENEKFISNEIYTKFCDDTLDEINSLMKLRKDSIKNSDVLISFLLYSLNYKKLNRTSNIWEEIGYWRDENKITIILDDENFELSFNNISENKYEIFINTETYIAKLISISDQNIEIDINNLSLKAFVSSDNKSQSWLSMGGLIFSLSRNDCLPEDESYVSESEEGDNSGILKSAMPGKVVKILVNEGDEVSKGDTVIVVESMKMENNLNATKDGKIGKLGASEGEMVDSSTILVEILDLN